MKLCNSCKDAMTNGEDNVNDDVNNDEPFDNDFDPSEIDDDYQGDEPGTPSSGGDQVMDLPDIPDADVNGSGGNGVGPQSEGGNESDKAKEDLTEAARKALEDLLSRDDVQETIHQTQHQIKNHKTDGLILETSYWETGNPLKMRGIKNSIISELSRLREQCDPGWRNRVDAGRLNLQRYIASDDSDTAFDVWREGNSDALDIEAVILVDTSGSMESIIHDTMESMWALKNSFDKVDIPCTVITFNWGSQILYKSAEKASDAIYRYRSAGGGTDPEDAFKQAIILFDDTTKSHKILITITDGDFSPHNDRFVEYLNQSGVSTSLLYLKKTDTAPSRIETHGHTLHSVVDHPRSIVAFVRNLVTNLIKSNI